MFKGHVNYPPAFQADFGLGLLEEAYTAPLCQNSGSTGGFFFQFCFGTRVEIFPFLLFCDFKPCLWRTVPVLRTPSHTFVFCIAFSTDQRTPTWNSPVIPLLLVQQTFTETQPTPTRLPALQAFYLNTALNFDYYHRYVLWTFCTSLPRARDQLPNSSYCARHVVPCT